MSIAIRTATEGRRQSAATSDDYGPPSRSAWQAIDWREHRRWIELDGRAVNVVELGDGPPVVLVHGLSGCWQNWLETIPHLARAHRVIALDLPGFGASELPREPISIPGYGRLLDRLCDRLEIDAAAVVGNSMGGFVAAELALAFPQRVERLVLVSAAGVSTEEARREPVLAVGRLLALTGTWGAAHLEVFARRPGLRRLALAMVVRHPRRIPAPLAFELMQGSGKPGFLPALEACLQHPIRQRLSEIVCPTLIVWGEDDRIIPVGDAHRYGRLIPHARKEIWPDTGHVPMLERPARFNALLDEFLSA